MIDVKLSTFAYILSCDSLRSNGNINLVDVKLLPEESHVHENVEPKSIFQFWLQVSVASRFPNSIPAAVEITHYHFFVGQHTVMNALKDVTQALVSETEVSREKSVAVCMFLVLPMLFNSMIQIVLFKKYNHSISTFVLIALKQLIHFKLTSGACST